MMVSVCGMKESGGDGRESYDDGLSPCSGTGSDEDLHVCVPGGCLKAQHDKKRNSSCSPGRNDGAFDIFRKT